jgi:hypothetical protein
MSLRIKNERGHLTDEVWVVKSKQLSESVNKKTVGRSVDPNYKLLSAVGNSGRTWTCYIFRG